MMIKTNITRKPGMQRRQKGIGIIEVLIALVVVSFGVLGMASLQLTGMKYSSGGFNRSKALLFAQSMTTRMRINGEAMNLTTANVYGGFDSDDISCDVPPVPYCQAREGVDAQMCTPNDLVAFDRYSVSCGDVGAGGGGADKGVIGSLPNGNLSVVCIPATCLPGSPYEVTVSWTEGRSRTDSDELITRRVQVRLKQ